MKAIITDLGSGEEQVMDFKAPSKEDTDAITPFESEVVRDMHEETIDSIICRLFNSAYPKHFNKWGTCTEDKQTFILSPHADMVREEDSQSELNANIERAIERLERNTFTIEQMTLQHERTREEDNSFVTYHNVSLREIARCMVEDTEEPEESHEE